ncbi:MAG: glycosyltransferase family 2 protein, partial [Enterococcus hirae]|nr:glycosyltransferase family 2 protein [Enterococcus hirae]
MKRISVIVPIYNGSLYLENTLQALLNQPYKNIELILIDDGSQDDSYQICQKFAQQDERILLIHQTNAGICA